MEALRGYVDFLIARGAPPGLRGLLAGQLPAAPTELELLDGVPAYTRDVGRAVAIAKDLRGCFADGQRRQQAFMAALSHPNPSARLLANYGDYGWNSLGDRMLGLRMMEEAVKADPDEPAYRITLIRMLAAVGRNEAARSELKRLESLNYGGRLDTSLAQLRATLAAQ